MEATRLFFLGEAGLANGFRLAGFEVYPNADIETLDRLLSELIDQRQRAFVILDHDLADADSDLLEQVRSEGGRILLTQIPPLNRPDDQHSTIDREIEKLLGNALEAE